MVIDHVLPQRLGFDSDHLNTLRLEYNLAGDFSVDDPANLVPAHQACNLQKGGKVLHSAALHFYLGIAREKAARVKTEEMRLVRKLRADRLLGDLGVALEEGILSSESVRAVVGSESRAERDTDPIVITFGLSVLELLDREQLPEDAPGDYVHLCDWLEGDLVNRLEGALGCRMYLAEASARNGESLSVRVALIQPDLERLEALEGSWWEILEIGYFSEIYN
jgi:hypothetical protein